MDRWKSTARKKLGRGESQKGEDKRWRTSDMEKVRREKMQARESCKTPCFSDVLWLRRSMCRLAKGGGRVRRHLGRWEIKICAPLWRETHCAVKSVKTRRSGTIFGSWDVEKVHAVVARSTFWSKKCQNTSGPEHFWKLRCGKARAVVARSTFGSQNA